MKTLLTFLGLLIGASAFGGPDANQPVRFYTHIPWSVGFDMKGTVTNVVATDEQIHFQFNGWFYIHQYPWGGTNEEVIKVDCQRGISASVSLTDSFVATLPNVNAAAEKKREDLLPIFEAAEEHGRELTIELLWPKLAFGEQSFLQDARVSRITDWDLR
jgi:hypothetical protein